MTPKKVRNKASRSTFKPAVAFDSEQAARKNIEVKIEFLTNVCDKRVTFLALAEMPDEKFNELAKMLPDSKRKFNSLSTSKLPSELRYGAPDFQPNAAVTLRKDKGLTGLVENLLRAIKEFSRVNAPLRAQEVKRAALTRKLILANSLRKIAEATIIDQKRTISTLKGNLLALENRLVALARESEKVTHSLRQEIKHLRETYVVRQKSDVTVVSLKRGREKN